MAVSCQSLVCPGQGGKSEVLARLYLISPIQLTKDRVPVDRTTLPNLAEQLWAKRVLAKAILSTQVLIVM